MALVPRRTGRCCPKKRKAPVPPVALTCAVPDVPSEFLASFCTDFKGSVAPFIITAAPPGTIIGPSPPPDDPATVFQIASTIGVNQAALVSPTQLFSPSAQRFCVCARFRVDNISGAGSIRVGLRGPLGQELIVGAVDGNFIFEGTDAQANTFAQAGFVAFDNNYHSWRFCGTHDANGNTAFQLFQDDVLVANANLALMFSLSASIVVQAVADLRIDSYCAQWELLPPP